MDNLIPTIYEEMGSDEENESENLYEYYINCSNEQKDAIDNVMMYLTGWTMKTLITKAK